MPDPTPNPPLTELLARASRGERQATNDLFPLVYAELRTLADRALASESKAQTLQPTALVHEAYLRLVGPADQGWQSRAHFFGAASQAIRRILIDHARARQAQKRGGEAHAVSIDGAEHLAADESAPDLLALDEALNELAALDPQKARIVELRFFGGLTGDEIAQALGVSPSTVARDWQFSRAWLHSRLSAFDDT